MIMVIMVKVGMILRHMSDGIIDVPTIDEKYV
jgi:hypothetical protein